VRFVSSTSIITVLQIVKRKFFALFKPNTFLCNSNVFVLFEDNTHCLQKYRFTSQAYVILSRTHFSLVMRSRLSPVTKILVLKLYYVEKIVQYSITHLSHAKKNHLYLPRPFQTGPCRRLRKNRRCAMHTPFWCKTCYWSTAAKIFSKTPAR
jgi:hypothetical protein